MITAETHAQMPMQCFIHVKSQFREKNPILPFEKFPFLVLPRNTIMLPHLIHSSFHYLSTGRLREVKNKLLAIKVVAVAYETNREVVAYKRFQILYSDLTCKLFLFWKTGR